MNRQLSDEEIKAIYDYHNLDQQKLQGLKDTANWLHINSIQVTTVASLGHPTSCCSAAEIMVVFFHTMKYNHQDSRDPSNNRFVLSKGHRLSYVAISFLGQGHGAAYGMAYTGKYFSQASHCVYCLVGDGEVSEVSM
uniref:Transketolase N-terminal domain-containing protein n=1 Tax=Vombatus ursinus TaxID=29139 RepID=A0A4X2KTG1_VOMUR